MAHIEALLLEAKTTRTDHQRPAVTLTYAQSLDGSITAQRGSPLALSGPASARLTHELRAAHDAILVGIGTVLADDPRLNVRQISGKDPQPVILDSQLRFPLQARLLQPSASQGLAPWIATTQAADGSRAAALQARGARLLQLPAAPDGRIPLHALLERLSDLGIGSLMVEGGAQVITSFFSERLVDLVILTLAPVFVGGLPAIERSLAQAVDPASPAFPRLQDWQCERLGDDLVLWGRPVWPGARD